MLKNFLMKQMVKHQTKGMSDAQRTQVMTILEKDPKLFEKIAKEVEQRKKGGESEVKASIDVMKKYKDELQKVLTS